MPRRRGVAASTLIAAISLGLAPSATTGDEPLLPFVNAGDNPPPDNAGSEQPPSEQPPGDQSSNGGAPQSESGEEQAPQPASEPRPRSHTVTLSNERTLSRWAYVYRPTPARRSPSRRSKVIKRLNDYTADGTPELVLVLKERRQSNGNIWAYVRIPMRPNGRKGWVRRQDLGGYRRVTTMFSVNRSRFKAVLYRNGRRIWSASIGVGKRKWPTPSGRYYVRERLVPREKNGVYGVFAFGTSAYSPTLSDWPGGGVIGVHGTNQPGLIPGRISHGCIRLRNSAISRLKRLMPLGTPIRIV